MLLNILALIAGFPMVIKGADWLVDGASAIAKRLHVSDLAIGLTIVAFGTSAPELIVNIFSTVQGNTDIAIGNVLGSNIANILLILGISAVIYPLAVGKGTAWKEIPFSLLAAIMLAAMANDRWIDGGSANVITRTDGLTLLGFFAIFLYYTYGISKNGTEVEGPKGMKEVKGLSAALSVIGGLLLLVVGGKFIVDGAVSIASGLGVSQSLIGLTIVAVGTSLPELATSIVAARKKKPDIAVGNVVGSNIFNIFFVLGVSSLIAPLPTSAGTQMDLLVVCLATILLFVTLFTGARQKIDRWQGAGMIFIYLIYIAFLVARG